MTENFVIFGATSNVAKRYIFPALAALFTEEGLANTCSIIGVGRRDWTTPQFQEHVSECLGTHRPALPAGCRERLLALLQYVRVEDLSDVKKIESIFKSKPTSCLLYLGLPPQLFPTVLKALSQGNISSDIRIILEKPFGLNHEESKKLNKLLHEQFSEESIFRMDHFLGMAVIQNLLSLRFESQLFAPLWNNRHIKKIEVIWDETLALDGRAEYYDRAGALKDMIQSHLLQILAVVAMEPLKSIESPEFRDKRVDVFRSVRKMSKAEIQSHTVRARYQAGQVHGKKIAAYAKEAGVDADRKTETFAQVALWVDNDRWQGVPFILRSGKALKQDRMEIAVYFKNGQESSRLSSHESYDVLRIDLDTDESNLELFQADKTHGRSLNTITFEAELPSQELPPYGRLFQEAMSGNPRLFIRNDEVEEMWGIIQPITDGWTKKYVPLRTYRAGSKGPYSERSKISGGKLMKEILFSIRVFSPTHLTKF